MSQQRTGHRVVVVLIVLMQVLQVLSLAAWLFAILFAGSALSEDQANAGTFAFVGAIFAYPLWLLGMAVTTWILVRRDAPRWGVFVAFIATVPVLILVGITLFVA